jgi:hypothetical protein
MSARETAVDVLIGSALLAILVTLFAIVFGAIGLAIYGLELGVRHFFPGLARAWEVEFSVFVILSSLISGIGQLRKRRLASAFLSFAIIPMIASVWFADPHFRRNDALFTSIWIVVVLTASNDALLTRLEFALTGFVVSATVAVNTGLLGAGTLAGFATNSVFVAVIALIVIYFRREPWKRTGPQPTPPQTA